MRDQVKLLREQLLVVRQVVPEQRERLGERTPAQDDLGAAARDRVQGGEALEHPYRIVGAQNRDRRAELDSLGLRGDSRQHDLRRGDRVVVTVVLTDTERVDADPVREDRLLDDVPDDLRVRDGLAVVADRDVAERVQPEFYFWIFHRRS